jgi:hypothetical protein
MWKPQWYVNKYSRMNNESIKKGILSSELQQAIQVSDLNVT